MNRKRPSGKESRGSGIKGKHRRSARKPVLYLLLLVAVVAIMVVLNQVSNKPSRADKNQNENSRRSGAPAFVKEGELNFYQADSTHIVLIEIEIADDDPQREQGLMFRRQMDEDKGMLFIFAEPDYRSFWMKNTHLPLDIMYLDENKRVINIHENTTPMTEESYESDEPAQYVVETNAGFSARYGIKPGCLVDFIRTY